MDPDIKRKIIIWSDPDPTVFDGRSGAGLFLEVRSGSGSNPSGSKGIYSTYIQAQIRHHINNISIILTFIS